MEQTNVVNSSRSLLLSLVAALLTSSAFASGWGDDYKAALATAAKENKKVLLDFTGSDWCGWCIRLKKETFDQPAFKEFADKNLVLVEVDFPQGKTLPNALKMQNDGLQEQYQVQGFPTLVLLSPAGKVIKQESGYIPGGPKGFIDWVNSAK
jgi:thioredoxin-related protein